MEALRRMLADGAWLPLNRDGAAGWVTDDVVWFVSKRPPMRHGDSCRLCHATIPAANTSASDACERAPTLA
jgi:hypothetical protein